MKIRPAVLELLQDRPLIDNAKIAGETRTERTDKVFFAYGKA